MKQKYLRLFLLMSIVYTNAFAQPAIYSFAPGFGSIGTTVNISGAKFSARPAGNIVFFGAVRARVSSATTTSLQVIVPAGATYQPITVTVRGLTAYADKPFIVTFDGGGKGFTQESFAARSDFEAGTYPGRISAADMDCDGKPDIVTDNQFSNTVSVLRNTGTTGNISFAGKVDFPVGSQPFGNFLADLNGDSKKDIVVANFASNTFSVLKNVSTGGIMSFDAKIDFATGASPSSTFVYDLNGDGKPDIAVPNGQGQTVSVFKNTSVNGIVSFAPKIDYATGIQPNDVFIDDLDGDGKPDMVTANFNGHSISIFRNTTVSGVLSFDPAVNIASGGYSESVAAGDLDGDGKPDLAVANVSPNGVAIFRNTSTPGNISFAKQVNYMAGRDARRVSLTDLDGDGKVDIAVTSQKDNFVSLFANMSTPGTISFSERVDFATGKSPSGISLVDLDGDGKPDIAVTNSNNSTVSVFRNAINNARPAVSAATGVSIEQDDADLNVKPNPGNGNFSIQVQLPDKQLAALLVIYDNYGRKIWQEEEGNISGRFCKTLFLQNKLIAGTYMLGIERSDIKLNRKIVINK